MEVSMFMLISYNNLNKCSWNVNSYAVRKRAVYM